MNKREIIDYYQECESDYRIFWDLKFSSAMHAGYWDQETKNLRQALSRENEILAQMIQIKSHDRVLDAGCGIGGSAIFLATHYHCHVTGISLSAHQISKARQLSFDQGVADRVYFQIADFTATEFSDHSFDVVWGLESVCHADNKALFIKEAYRLLKPGGRLIIADGFAKQGVDLKRASQMKKWLTGFSVASLETTEAFSRYLHEAGFRAISFLDITPHILPSSQRLFWISAIAFPFFKAGEWIGLRTARQTAHVKAAYYQYRTLKKKLWHYGIFTAVKPN